MKRSKRIAIAAIAIILLAATVVPAFAAVSQYALTVRNKTTTNVTLILRGPDDMEVEITRLTTIIRLEEGRYSYRYTACGLRHEGQFTLTAAGRTLTLRKCEKAPNTKINIDNRTGALFYLRLYGPQRYNFALKPGVNAVTIAAGRYTWSALVCGKTQTGDKPIKSKNNADWIWRCNN
jgi:hypothetical protein